MKYCLMLEDGQYIESNFTLIVINAHQAGHLDNLVVLYPITSFHSDLDIEPQTVIIVDPSKNYLSRNMTLVKVSKNMIQEPYLEYLSRHEMDGTTKSNCCNSDIIENTDLCSDCKEHSIPKVSKEDWRRRDKIKSKIKDITSIYFDTFDVLENCNQLGLVNFMKNNNIKTFQELVLKIKKFLIPYGYTILHRKSVWVNFDTNGTMDVKHSVSDGIGKFFIIKNEEKYLEKVLTKPITIYANKDETRLHYWKSR